MHAIATVGLARAEEPLKSTAAPKFDRTIRLFQPERTRGPREDAVIATTGVGVVMLVIALVALAALAVSIGNDDHRRSSSSPN